MSRTWCIFCYEEIETINENWEVLFCNEKCHDSYFQFMNLLSQVTLRGKSN